MDKYTIEKDKLDSLVKEIRKIKGSTSPIKGRDCAEEIRNLNQPTLEGYFQDVITTSNLVSSFVKIPGVSNLGKGKDGTASLFSGFTKLTELPHINFYGASSATYVFQNCSSVVEAGDCDFGTVTNLSYAFSGCSSLQKIGAIVANNVTNFSYMFRNCAALQEVPSISGISNATSVSNMFEGCKAITSFPDWKLPEVTSLYCFLKDTGITSCPAIEAPSVTTIGYLYNNCKNLLEGTLPPNIKPTSATGVFSGCSSITQIHDFDSSLITTATSFCEGCSSLISFPETDWTSLTSGNNMFYGCKLLENIVMNNTNNLTNAENMFRNCEKITTNPIDNTSKITNMRYMFDGCSSLIDLGNLDTSSVTNMSSLFRNCKALESIPELDFSLVTNVDYLFSYTNIQEFDILTFPKAKEIRGIFYGAKIEKLNELHCPEGIGTSYSELFYNSSLKEAGIIDVPKLKSGRAMFYGCKNLEKIGEIIMPQITSCYQMFGYCSVLQEIPPIDLTNVTTTYDMFFQCPNLNKIYFKGSCDKLTTTTGMFGNLYTRGTMYYSPKYDYSKIISLLPRFWKAEPYIEIIECTNLSIEAQDINGLQTYTMIDYTATVNGIDIFSGEEITGVTVTGRVESAPIEENNTEAPISREITFEFYGQTATTTIEQSIKPEKGYSINLNNEWTFNTNGNLSSDTYDGRYESIVSVTEKTGSTATLVLEIEGYDNFVLYIASRGYYEDYVMTSNLDEDMEKRPEYAYANTKGKSNSYSTIDGYTKVEYNNIGYGKHTIYIKYYNAHYTQTYNSQGYLLIPLNQ